MSLSGIPYDDENVFKKIVEGTIPSYKIFETEHALAFLEAFPMCKARTQRILYSRTLLGAAAGAREGAAQRR